jgi:hypothetical protein
VSVALNQPYYYSPELTLDPKTGSAVLEIRDTKTGAIKAQYPSEKDLAAYSQHKLPVESTTAAPAVAPVTVPSAPAVTTASTAPAAAPSQTAAAAVSVSTAPVAPATPAPTPTTTTASVVV